MSAISNLSNLSNISRLGSVRRPNKKAYLFDWVNDYIAWDTTIGRTGYDLNVQGNVSTGSDADGSYFWINWNRDGTAATWTVARIWWGVTTPLFDQTTSFTIKAKFKFSAFPANNSSGLFWSNQDASIHLNTASLWYWLRWSSTVGNSTAVSINTLYDMYLVYDAAQTKFFWYLGTSGWASSLLNVWWTSWPATFSTNDRFVWDNTILAWNPTSANKFIYHAAIRNVALTQAEIDADIALWNTTKTDSRIVAYYIPENLQYNTQYITAPKDLTDAAWTKGSGVTITANYAVAPDGTTTADRVVRWTWGSPFSQWIREYDTTITWSTLANKTFIVKAFVRAVSWTYTFRLDMGHSGVSSYYSGDFTATTDWQEFTYTKTFWAWTTWTWIDAWIVTDVAWTAVDLEVRNVRVFVTNETLRDESPNIGWYIGWKTQKVFSCWCKPNADWVDTAASQWLMHWPWAYLYIRTSTNAVKMRWDSRLTARDSSYTLWAWFRNKVHIIWCFYRTGSVWATKLYINWVLQDSDLTVVDAPSAITNTVLWSGRISTTYYSWYIRDPRIYTFTWSFTDADALAIYNWWEPSSAWITKYLHWRPTPWEAWTTTIDHAGNSRTGTLNGGVTRPFLSWS